MADTKDVIRIKTIETASGAAIDTDVFSVCYVSRGDCVLNSDEVTLFLHEGEAALLQIGILYTATGDSTMTLIDFTNELFTRYCMPVISGNPILNSFFIHNAKAPSVSSLHFSRLDQPIRDQIATMCSEYDRQLEGYREILICYLSSLLLYLGRCCRMNATVTEAPNSQLLQKILDFMMTNFSTVTLEDLAHQFSYHPNSMASIIKRGTGKTFSDMLLQIRMSHAAELLRNPKNSVRAVAQICGYSNMTNFYTRFKAYFGMTPAEYAGSMPQYATTKSS